MEFDGTCNARKEKGKVKREVHPITSHDDTKGEQITLSFP